MLNYTPKNEKELLEIALRKAQEKNLIKNTQNNTENEDIIQTILQDYNNIENQYIHDLNTHAYLNTILEQDITRGYNNTSIETADDEGLENIGLMWNMPRVQPKHNLVNLIFNIDKPYESNEDYNATYLIPAGTQVTNNHNPSIIYETSRDVSISKGETSVSVPATSINTGTQNSVPALYLDTIIDKSKILYVNNTRYNDYDLNVINNERSEGGTDGETLEHYRTRLLNDRFKSYERGTYAQINNFLLNYPNLNDYKLIPHYAGAGTYKIIIRTVPSIEEEFINRLKEDIKSVELFDDDYAIITNTNLEYHNHIHCNISVPSSYSDSERQNIMLKTRNLIQTYINGGYLPTGEYYTGLSIGESFNTYQCGVFLHEYISVITDMVWVNSDYHVAADSTLLCDLRNIIVNLEK